MLQATDQSHLLAPILGLGCRKSQSSVSSVSVDLTSTGHESIPVPAVFLFVLNISWQKPNIIIHYLTSAWFFCLSLGCKWCCKMYPIQPLTMPLDVHSRAIHGSQLDNLTVRLGYFRWPAMELGAVSSLWNMSKPTSVCLKMGLYTSKSHFCET